MSLYHTLVSTPYGEWSVCDDGDRVVGFDYWPELGSFAETSRLGQEVRRQVAAYLADGQFRFDLPLKPSGTEFQQRVWQLMCEIPAGEVRTYGDVAQELGSAARAVGGACRVNPIPLIIPCHRIVAKQGLGGFSGQTEGVTLTLKERLLSHEGAL